jgi:hypothetical protein
LNDFLNELDRGVADYIDKEEEPKWENIALEGGYNMKQRTTTTRTNSNNTTPLATLAQPQDNNANNQKEESKGGRETFQQVPYKT